MGKAIVFLTDGFEDIEAIATLDILKRGGVDAVSVSITKSLLVTSKFGISVNADALINDKMTDADMLCLPGGPGYVSYFENQALLKLINYYNDNGKYIAAICAAPILLGRMGLLEAKRVVCFPGMENELSGAILSSDKVVVSGNIITSKGAGTTIDFALKLVELLTDIETANSVRDNICY